MKNIICQNKKVPISEKLFVKHNGNDAEILICDICPHSCDKCQGCLTCHGKIILVKETKFDKKTDDYKEIKTILRDKYLEKKGKIKHLNEATNFLSECDIISRTSQDTKESKGSMNHPWIAYDRPRTWKTDCKECIAKYGEMTPCKNVKENRSNGLPDFFCPRQKQTQVKIY